MKTRYLLITLMILFFIFCRASNEIKEPDFRNTIVTFNEKISCNVTNKYLDTLLLSSKHFGEITIFVNKPNFYNIVKTRKFEPLYIFSNNRLLSGQYINSNIKNPFTAEAFIYIIVDVDFKNQDTSKFSDFLKIELFPFIEKKYRCFDFKYAIAENHSTKVLSDILINDTNLFDFYLFIQPNAISIKNLENVNDLECQTQKSINLIQLKDNQSQIQLTSNPELIVFNNHVIIESIKDDIELAEKIKNSSLKLVKKYNQSISNIEDEFFENNFEKGDSIISILEDYSKLKIKLLTPRNTNQLAYNIQSYGQNELSIRIIDWAISKFPESINLYHSKGELYYKIGDRENAKITYEKFKEVVILNKDNLDKTTFVYYLKLYEKSINGME